MKKLFVIALLSLIAFYACDNNTSRKIDEKFDRSGQLIKIKVHYFSNETDLKKEYQRLNQVPLSRVPDQYGFAQWPEWKDEEGNKVEKPELFRCDIYIMRPERIDDNNVLTLGHEMVDCLHGSYHK